MSLIELHESNLRFAKQLGIIPHIHSQDFIYRHHERRRKDPEKAVSAYYRGSRNSAAMLKTFIDDVSRVKVRLEEKRKMFSILDFASGYGGVARHLPQLFPEATITACDIHEEAVRFNTDYLNIRSLISANEPEELDVGQYDLVFCLSFFSHMPKVTFQRWLRALSKALNPGGVLLFTAHGFVTSEVGNFGITVAGDGFGFKPQSEQGDLDKETYGTTISMPRFVLECINNCDGIRLHHFREAIWWNIQDTYVCIRS